LVLAAGGLRRLLHAALDALAQDGVGAVVAPVFAPAVFTAGVEGALGALRAGVLAARLRGRFVGAAQDAVAEGILGSSLALVFAAALAAADREDLTGVRLTAFLAGGFIRWFVSAILAQADRERLLAASAALAFTASMLEACADHLLGVGTAALLAGGLRRRRRLIAEIEAACQDLSRPVGAPLLGAPLAAADGFRLFRGPGAAFLAGGLLRRFVGTAFEALVKRSARLASARVFASSVRDAGAEDILRAGAAAVLAVGLGGRRLLAVLGDAVVEGVIAAGGAFALTDAGGEALPQDAVGDRGAAFLAGGLGGRLLALTCDARGERLPAAIVAKILTAALLAARVEDAVRFLLAEVLAGRRRWRLLAIGQTLLEESPSSPLAGIGAAAGLAALREDRVSARFAGFAAVVRAAALHGGSGNEVPEG
jgi:hypothetical protein